MSLITKEELLFIADKNGYRPEILEKVYQLLDFLRTMMDIPFARPWLITQL